MKKKFLALVGICLILSFSTTAYAQEDSFWIEGELHTYTEIAERTGLDEEKLKEFALECPEEFYADAKELFYGNTETYPPKRAAIGMISYKSLDTMVKEQAKEGYFLISATNHTKLVLDYRHGHAGLIVNPQSLEMVHAPGPGATSERASVRSMTSLSDAKMKMRLYRVQNVSDLTAQRVAEYAEENLIGIPYGFDSKVTDNTVNCATLVWRAYESQGIKLGKYFYTVTPESLVQDYKTIGVATVNWQGDQNSFDLVQTTEYDMEQ